MPLNKNDFQIKRNDTLPALQLSLSYENGLGARYGFHLSGITSINFTMVSSCGDYKVISKSAQTICESGGTFQYNWDPEDTNEDGKFKGEFQILFSGGSKISVPQQGYIDINITKDINPFN